MSYSRVLFTLITFKLILKKYFSPAQVESDQKDLIISQLKADIFELKKNEQECFELSQQIKSLEAKYQSLYEENVKTLNFHQKTKKKQFIKKNKKNSKETMQNSRLATKLT